MINHKKSTILIQSLGALAALYVTACNGAAPSSPTNNAAVKAPDTGNSPTSTLATTQPTASTHVQTASQPQITDEPDPEADFKKLCTLVERAGLLNPDQSFEAHLEFMPDIATGSITSRDAKISGSCLIGHMSFTISGEHRVGYTDGYKDFNSAATFSHVFAADLSAMPASTNQYNETNRTGKVTTKSQLSGTGQTFQF